jgi:hypothetical protein
METIFELINRYKEKNTKGVFNKIVKITSKRLDYLSSLCSKYKELNVFSDILWCDWWELEDISEITDENIEFYARHLYEGEYDTIIVPIHWFTISDEEFLNEIRAREINRIDIYINKHQKIIDDFYKEFPKVKRWMDETNTNAKTFGYVEDFWGRRRRLPDILLPKYTIEDKNNKNITFNPILGCLGKYNPENNPKMKFKSDSITSEKITPIKLSFPPLMIG